MPLHFPSHYIYYSKPNTKNSHTNPNLILSPQPTHNPSKSSLIMSNILVFLLLCLSLHACNARHLRVIDKDVGKAEDHKASIALKLRPSITVEHQPREDHVAENGETETLSPEGANTMKKKDSNALWKGDNSKGKEATSSQGVLKEASKTEGRKRQARSTLGSVPHDVEENVNSKENDISEDVVVMDYAQPHRKPPIHNREP